MEDLVLSSPVRGTTPSCYGPDTVLNAFCKGIHRCRDPSDSQQIPAAPLITGSQQ